MLRRTGPKIRIAEYFVEYEILNVVDIGKLFIGCRCGGKCIGLSNPVEKDFRKQGFCNRCGKLLYTISVKITFIQRFTGKSE